MGERRIRGTGRLGGERPAGAATEIFFRYRLQGGDSMRVVLVNRTAKVNHIATLGGLAQGAGVAVPA